MREDARHQAAIEILDAWLAGTPLEKALTGWARRSRFAGSRDRAAVRDIVFDAVRKRRSAAARGGSETGRGLVLGLLVENETDPDTVFTGAPHAPAPLDAAERAHLAAPPAMPPNVALDVPDWLAPRLESALGPDHAPVMALMRERAPVFLRVNTLRGSREEAQARLAEEGIATRPHPLADTALEVTGGTRRIRQSAAFREGLVELQDAASQAVVAALPLAPGMRVLDQCAGGGGKALAMAARMGGKGTILAHDADPGRMKDLPARAARAGVRITRTTRPEGAFDLVLADVPCSGSGAWRRSPEGKWRLTPARLDDLIRLQDRILDEAAPLVAPGGWLAHVTCSLLDEENRDRAEAFLARHREFALEKSRRWTPLAGGDGFGLALFRRKRGTGGRR